jgi:small subunit ribosomal protein S6
MRINYESMVVLRSTLSDEQINAVLGKIREMIEKIGGAVLQAENWGKRKLAYEVQSEKRGTFLLFRFQADGKQIAELERQYRLDEAVLKFITVRLEGPLPPGTPSGKAGDRKSAHEGATVETSDDLAAAPPGTAKESLK